IKSHEALDCAREQGLKCSSAYLHDQAEISAAEPEAGPKEYQKDLIPRRAEIHRDGIEGIRGRVVLRNLFDKLLRAAYTNYEGCRQALPSGIGAEDARRDRRNLNRAGTHIA